jgi:hypothetical protein
MYNDTRRKNNDQDGKDQSVHTTSIKKGERAGNMMGKYRRKTDENIIVTK